MITGTALFLVVIVFVVYLMFWKGSKVAFVSANRSYRWDVNSNVIKRNVETKLFPNGDSFRWILVVIGNEYIETGLKTGLREDDQPFASYEWKVYGPVDVLYVYINPPVWSKLDKVREDNLLSEYILGVLIPGMTGSAFSMPDAVNLLKSNGYLLRII